MLVSDVEPWMHVFAVFTACIGPSLCASEGMDAVMLIGTRILFLVVGLIRNCGLAWYSHSGPLGQNITQQ